MVSRDYHIIIVLDIITAFQLLRINSKNQIRKIIG